jgi:hypothetical protein
MKNPIGGQSKMHQQRDLLDPSRRLHGRIDPDLGESRIAMVVA